MEPLTSEELSAVAAAYERLRNRHRFAPTYRLGVGAVQPLTLRCSVRGGEPMPGA